MPAYIRPSRQLSKVQDNIGPTQKPADDGPRDESRKYNVQDDGCPKQPRMIRPRHAPCGGTKHAAPHQPKLMAESQDRA